MRLAVAVLLLLLSGCLGTETTPVEWTVRNDGDAAIDYQIRLHDSGESHTLTGTLAPGEAATRIMPVSGRDMDAEARLVGEPATSSVVPMRIDILCFYAVDAVWDGAAWGVEAEQLECR